MKLTVDCTLTDELTGLQNAEALQASSLAFLLSRAKLTQVDLPLEALVCEQHGLRATPDYPIAAIAASADELDDAPQLYDGYWLRADPVHLVLQRDYFSLGEPIPLAVDAEHAKDLIKSLNQHFAQDGLTFLIGKPDLIGKSGAWYLHTNDEVHIKTTLPFLAAGKNVHQFMPQGEHAAKWLTVLNEAQMLLHEHPANVARESNRELAINSIWLSGGGKMSASTLAKNAIVKNTVPENSVDLVITSSVFYQGLAAVVSSDYLVRPIQPDDILQHIEAQKIKHVRLQLPQLNNLDHLWFKAILAAVRHKKIKQLTLNLGFYEKTLVAEITHFDLYKFWRKTRPVAHYLK